MLGTSNTRKAQRFACLQWIFKSILLIIKYRNYNCNYNQFFTSQQRTGPSFLVALHQGPPVPPRRCPLATEPELVVVSQQGRLCQEGVGPGGLSRVWARRGRSAGTARGLVLGAVPLLLCSSMQLQLQPPPSASPCLSPSAAPAAPEVAVLALPHGMPYPVAGGLQLHACSCGTSQTGLQLCHLTHSIACHPPRLSGLPCPGCANTLMLTKVALQEPASFSVCSFHFFLNKHLPHILKSNPEKEKKKKELKKKKSKHPLHKHLQEPTTICGLCDSGKSGGDVQIYRFGCCRMICKHVPGSVQAFHGSLGLTFTF